MIATAFTVPPHVPMQALHRIADISRSGIAKPRLFYAPEQGGHWVATQPDDIAAILDDPSLFSSQGASMAGVPLPPFDLDPPSHRVYRRLLSPFFADGRVARLAPAITASARATARALAPLGSTEFVADFATPVARAALAQFMGLAPSAMAQAPDALVAACRAHPGGDVVSLLLAMRLGGIKLPRDTIIDLTRTLLLTSIVPVVSHLSRCLRDEALYRTGDGPAAVSPLRLARRDTIIAGYEVARGDRILLWIEPARDHAALLFSVGPHRCPAAPLARLIAHLALDAFRLAIPACHRDPDRAPVTQPVTHHWPADAPERLWLRWPQAS